MAFGDGSAATAGVMTLDQSVTGHGCFALEAYHVGVLSCHVLSQVLNNT